MYLHTKAKTYGARIEKMKLITSRSRKEEEEDIIRLNVDEGCFSITTTHFFMFNKNYDFFFLEFLQISLEFSTVSFYTLHKIKTIKLFDS